MFACMHVCVAKYNGKPLDQKELSGFAPGTQGMALGPRFSPSHDEIKMKFNISCTKKKERKKKRRVNIDL